MSKMDKVQPQDKDLGYKQSYLILKMINSLMPTNFKRQKLLEWSAVPVPSNPEGLAQARSFGIDTTPIIGWADNRSTDNRIFSVPLSKHN